MRRWIPSLLVLWLGAVPLFVWGCSNAAGPDTNFESGGSGNSGGKGSGGSGNGSSSGGTGGIVIPIEDGGMVPNPCDQPDAPPDCMLVAPPGCGDGEKNQDSEQCDDGNTLPGDCCSGACQTEQYCECDAAGANCHTTIVCGDGMRGPGEACDDGNTNAGDGCSADCHVIELGYRCANPGQACVRVYVCSDGIVDPNEGCDDHNLMPGDGCSERCRIEQGFKCDGSPSQCSPTTCGDGKQEGAESCDDGNTVAFDGCSPDCRAEPKCDTGKACTSSCGDAIVFGSEECDDGNLRPGDGCSADCKVEDGYMCNNDAPCTRKMGVDPTTLETGDICTLAVSATFRDFNAQSATSTPHPDFSPGRNAPGAVQGIVKPDLDADGKPVLALVNNATAFTHTAADFAEWYRNDPPASKPIGGSVVLWDKGGIAGDGTAGYVNRWGANGEQWVGYPHGNSDGVAYPEPAQCSDTDCTAANCATIPTEINGIAAPPGSQIVCLDDCIPWGTNTQACFAAKQPFDGNPLFFPIDTGAGLLTETREAAKVPEQYGFMGWPWETDVATALGVTMPIPTATSPFPSKTHNFSFTTEVKYWFKYEANTMATLDFTGDDDVWVFVNGHIAIDLGGWHVPLNGQISFNGATVNASSTTAVPPNVTTPMVVNKPGTATTYGLTAGNVYQIAIFHAERQKEGSSFKLTLGGFNMTPSDCRTDCGDGEVGPGEECDDGTNAGGYNMCSPGCVFGPRCGDGIPAAEYGEACDDGDAGNLGAWGGCGPDCQPGPRCGDGIVQTDHEQCDDGMNQGAYGGCAPGCVIGPHCGDTLVQIGFEECDDGNEIAKDGCSNCKFDVPVTK